MSGNTDVRGHNLDGGIPPEIVENFKDFFPEHDDLSYEEVLLQQESVYQSFQGKGKNSDFSSTANNSHGSGRSQLSGQEVESSSWGGSARSQEALDEALARSLQDLGEEFDDFFISEQSSTAAAGSVESPASATVREVSQATRQDDIDPDNMTFEELLTLRDTVGVESKGLSDGQISRLPTFKYKTGMFSKKKKIDDCVICQMTYNSGQRLTTLPCKHQYHSKCIVEWLKLSKNCPICQKEV